MTKTYGNFTDFINFSRASSGTALRKVSYGAELVTNGTFDTDTSGWTQSGNDASNYWEWSSGTARVISSGSFVPFSQICLTQGSIYTISLDVVATTGSIKIGSSAAAVYNDVAANVSSGSHVFTFVALSDTLYFSRYSGVTDATIDNISVKEVTFDQADGTLELFNHPAGIPRIEYDANGNELGLLIEEQRTNLVTYSDASKWGPSGPVTLTTQTDFSLGIFNGVKVASGGQTWHRAHQTNLSVTSGVAYACTLFYKAGTSGKVFMNLRDNTNITETRIGGTIGSCTVLQEFAGTAELLSEELIGDGVYRMQVKFTPNATITTFSFGAGPYSTTSGEDVIILGGQLEQGSFPTSYIPTSGATATRSADIADIATANFGYNQKAGTVVVEYSILAFDGNQTLFTLGETSGNLGVGWYSSTGHHRVSAAGLNGTSSYPIGSSDLEAGVGYLSSVYYAQSDVGISVDGGSVVSGSSYDPPLATVLTIGDDLNGGNSFNGHIKSIKYIPRRNSNTQLQEFTS